MTVAKRLHGLSASEAAAFALAAFSVAEPIAKASEAVQQAAHILLTERFSKHVQGGAVRLDAAVHIVEGSTHG